MKIIILFLIVISFNLFSQVKDTTHISNADYFSLFKDSVEVLELRNQLTVSKLNAKFDSLRSVVKENSNLKSKLNSLEKQVNIINSQNQLLTENRKKLIDLRYKLGKNILNNMIDGTSYLKNLNNLIVIKSNQDTVSNSEILEKLHLQNFWDKFSNYTPLLGLVVSGASAIFIHDPRTASIVGLSSVIVPGLFKIAFGHVNISDFASGLEYIGPTKKLYDEFNQRTFQIRELITQSETLRDTLISFENQYDNIPNIDSAKNVYYLKLQDKISEYQNLNRLVPLTINQILSYFDKYKNNPGFSYVYNKFENYSNDLLNEYIGNYAQSFNKLNDQNKQLLFNNALSLL